MCFSNVEKKVRMHNKGACMCSYRFSFSFPFFLDSSLLVRSLLSSCVCVKPRPRLFIRPVCVALHSFFQLPANQMRLVKMEANAISEAKWHNICGGTQINWKRTILKWGILSQNKRESSRFSPCKLFVLRLPVFFSYFLIFKISSICQK